MITNKWLVVPVTLALLLSPSAQVAAAASSPGDPELTALSLSGKFAEPNQTIEYHFMLDVPALAENERDKLFQSRVVEPLRALGDIGPLGKAKSGIYLDSKDLALDKKNLIVRVREGQITVKARAVSPESLVDLAACSAKKYEMDYFGEPNYSISSDINFKAGEFPALPPALTPAGLRHYLADKCPALSAQIEPFIKDAAVQIPGVATMYTADIKMKHPAAAKAKEASVTVWFFPPTGKSLVEFAYTGYIRDRAEMDALYAHALSLVKGAGLYKQEQISKTLQYLQAYLGAGR